MQGETPTSSSSMGTSLDDPALTAALKRIEELERENHLLQHKVDEQAQQHHSLISAATLRFRSEWAFVFGSLRIHGPDTIEHFDGFSVDGVLAEMRSHAPAVLELLNTIDQSSRHDDGTDLARLSQLRVMMSLTSLLKCWSVQVLGIQLLITFMLIARSTNKQTSKIKYTSMYTHMYLTNT